MIHNLPLLVIVGPTASGKTGLAIDIAKECGGEIICADSRTIYKDMNIGTAKPTANEQQMVPHFGLDLAVPGERYTAADFKQYAQRKIAEIRARGHVPILVGGTGLYVDAVIFDYEFGTQADAKLRIALQAMTLEELHKYAQKQGIQLPQNEKNTRYVVRAIEQNNRSPSRKNAPIENTIIVGIATDKVLLRTRIEQRTEQLFKNGIVDEAIMLGEKYGWENEAMTSNIYPLIRNYLLGLLTMQELREKNNIADWRLAKRQLTWLRRNECIQWFSIEQAKEYIIGELAK